MKSNVLKLIASILVCQAAGFLGGLFNRASIETWYPLLKKPAFNPPNWVFAPVWIGLYLLMGISLFLVWKASVPGEDKSRAIYYFFCQLVLNSLWSYAFFYRQSPGLALVIIMVLWLFILVTLVKFYPINKIASILFIPYLLWVSFAAVLNYSIWQLNR